MQLGFKEVDEKRQEERKKNFQFFRNMRKMDMIMVGVIYVGLIAVTIWSGVKSITDASYLSQFRDALIFTLIMLAIGFGIEPFLDWMFHTIFRSQNTEKLPKQSDRTLRKILNRMNGNIIGMVWDAIWICIGLSALITAVCTGGLHVQGVLSVGGKMLLIYVVGYAIFSYLHSRRDLTKKLLKQTKPFYNYGDGKTYAEYIDWSIREHLLLSCKQYMLTEEFFMGYAQGDLGFTPVAIPREFIKAAEMRLAYTADSKGSTSKAVLACLLHNGKVVDFYLSRFVGNEIAMELLKKKGFEFSVRIDRVEYQ